MNVIRESLDCLRLQFSLICVASVITVASYALLIAVDWRLALAVYGLRWAAGLEGRAREIGGKVI